MIKYLKKKILSILNINAIKKENEEIKLILGKILLNNNLNKKINKIEDIEFKIFSQFGDDGIIQFLINKLEIDESFCNFIEFGVENYQESNTKFLLQNNNWSGLVMDSSIKNIQTIRNSNYYWKFDLEAVHAFITRENINDLILKSKINKKIGLLSIDIDGNDYWVWDKINVVDPLIVVIEYNSNFGLKKKVCVPYEKNFQRSNSHYSNLYWGASLEALKHLGEKKGYKFLFTNSAGNNAYFLKTSKYEKVNFNLKVKSYISKFRESRDKDGKKTFLKGEDKIQEIKHLKVLDLETYEKLLLNDILK